MDVAGQATTAASRVLANNVAAVDAPVVERLRAAGAVSIGKTNLHEFALGTTSDESAYGPVHNPLDGTRSPGGSSGGSAAAVAVGMGLGSVGTDTGGSIRIPASACGIVGLMPSLRDVPTAGVIPLSVTFDHVGPITRTVQDAAWMWSALAARPARRVEPPALVALKLGALGGYFTALLDDEVRVAFDGAIARLREARVAIEPRTIQGTDEIVETYVNIVLPEAACWHAPYLDTRGDAYQPGVRTRIESGRAISAVKYLTARNKRAVLTHAVDVALERCDGLVLPTLPMVAPPIGATEVALGADRKAVPVRAAMLRLTQLFDITGHPAISIPIRTPGLPVGLQLVGRRDATEHLLAVAAACEAVVR